MQNVVLVVVDEDVVVVLLVVLAVGPVAQPNFWMRKLMVSAT